MVALTDRYGLENLEKTTRRSANSGTYRFRSAFQFWTRVIGGDDSCESWRMIRIRKT
jgi:hypothetical protein